MKKLVDRVDNEVVFFEGEEEKAREYLDVIGNTLDEIVINANLIESDFSERYYIKEV